MGSVGKHPDLEDRWISLMKDTIAEMTDITREEIKREGLDTAPKIISARLVNGVLTILTSYLSSLLKDSSREGDLKSGVLLTLDTCMDKVGEEGIPEFREIF